MAPLRVTTMSSSLLYRLTLAFSAPFSRDSLRVSRAIWISFSVIILFSSNSQALNQYGRNSAGDCHALLFPASPVAIVYLQVGSDCLDVRERLGAVPDDVDVFDRHGQAAVFDERSALDEESEISFSDLDFSI